ncbi:dihydrolipoyl dehydrogenase [Saccharibacillus sp. CPCC 101409]|uniref:dihydrolipoyl dehydrogenase n=1 Tax=Saccharibacillus sp. CPCC 101409 TaxID=3058041 RepID=UPI002673F823|nr:dihydrolipoyl dehydrogenase [Saccharibacillus sp. CPCC 101409]MDO3409562.1 dihydrolipoyl dehydrogenase [Saccharibacillus sp. CPCC 101409]
MTITCDVAVLGGGTGGYVAAIKAAQLGKNVIIIERGKLGGTCLHKGCIPTKSLLRSAEVYSLLQNAEAYGIEAGESRLLFPKVQERKQAVVDKLHQGVQYLMRKNKIRVIEGGGRIIGPSIFSPRSGAVAVELPDGEMETVVPDNLIIATGSRPRVLPGLEPDGRHILSSDEAVDLDRLPESILIVGGGVIGIEWASMLRDFGVEVTIAELAGQILPGEDEETARELAKLLERRGVKILTGVELRTDSLEKSGDGISIAALHKGEELRLSAAQMLVSVGRAANVEGIGLENTDIRVVKGSIQVNRNFQTGESHIYAIGDCIGGLQLAHAASHEGIAAAMHLAGEQPHAYDEAFIPRCVYSQPEVASVGLTESRARELGRSVKSAKVPFSAIGKALVEGHADGFAKVVADTETGDLVGVQIIGPHATELIAEAALAAVLDATPWEVGGSVHAHPTLSEALGEAMLAIDGSAINV